MEAAARSAQMVNSILPAVAILLPLVGGLAVYAVGDRSEKLRDWLAVVFSAGAFITCASMFPAVMERGSRLTIRLNMLFGQTRLTVDALSLVFALVASLLWMIATLYARNYIQHEERRTRYHAFSLFTEAATLGVFLASNFFVLFVFFELMGLLAYLLVIHNQTYEARRAGVKYIFMTVYGGLSLLFGVFLFVAYAKGLGFGATPGSAYLSSSICFVVAGFMIAGFGVKAGMVPLHVWLPLAHPAAPSPASALLSGVMIKAGAYGFIRVIGTFLTAPAGTHAGEAVARHGESVALASEHVPAYMHNLHNLGWVIVWLGIVTMVVGMVLALVQDNVKRLLAYSSISQMGYILMGLGAGAYLGAEGGMGLAGGVYHIINHALFKGLLFLGVGAVYYATHQLDMTRLGGLWRKMPVTTALTCIAGLGIMGIPLFNGFASKTLLHHAIVEAGHTGGPWMHAADILFIIAAGGTICYIAKLLTLTFFGRHRGEHDHKIREVPWAMQVGMGVLAAGVVFFGLFPTLIMDKIILPALRVFTGLEPEGLHHLAGIKIYTISNLTAFLPSLAIGVAVFLVATRWDLFRLRLPETYGIDHYYSRGEVGFLRLCFAGSKRYGELRAEYYPLVKSTGEYLHDWWNTAYRDYRRFRRAAYGRVVGLPMDIAGFASYVRARQFTGDIAYGVIIFAAVIAIFFLTLL